MYERIDRTHVPHVCTCMLHKNILPRDVFSPYFRGGEFLTVEFLPGIDYYFFYYAFYMLYANVAIVYAFIEKK